MIHPKLSLPVLALVAALSSGCSGGNEENPVTPEKVKMMNEERAKNPSGPSRSAAPGTGAVDHGPGAKP